MREEQKNDEINFVLLSEKSRTEFIPSLPRLRFRFDVGFVVRAHRAERAHLMIREFVVGITMLGAEDASGARMASRSAVRLYFHAMGQALRDVPSGFDAHCAGRACRNAGARRATGTWIEAEGVAR